MGDATETRQKVVLGVLRVDPQLHGIAPEADCFLREVQWRTGGNPELLLNDVNPGDLFRNRMFNLNARIHFHEINVFVDQQEFNGARAFIPYGPGGFYCQLAQSLSQLIADLGAGCNLNQLLVPPLY